MPLDKMPDPDEFILTHRSKILHTKGNPVACIIDNENASRYALLGSDPSLKASLIGFLNKHDDLGLLMGFKLKIKTDTEFFEYTVYPDEGFVDAVILNETIHIINDSMDSLFSLKKIVTDQFVKTRSEFDKFKKMIN